MRPPPPAVFRRRAMVPPFMRASPAKAGRVLPGSADAAVPAGRPSAPSRPLTRDKDVGCADASFVGGSRLC
jgi:hypothetical protein